MDINAAAVNAERASFLIARKTPDGCVEYWTGDGWSMNKTNAKPYRTLQAVDKAGAEIDSAIRIYCE